MSLLRLLFNPCENRSVLSYFYKLNISNWFLRVYFSASHWKLSTDGAGLLWLLLTTPHWQSSVSYLCHPHVIRHPSCLILRTIAIHMLFWWLSQKDSFRSHMTALKPMIFITCTFYSSYREKTINGTDDVIAWSYYEIPDWPIPMLPLLQMLIKNLLQQWALNSALPSSRIEAGCKVVVILPF